MSWALWQVIGVVLIGSGLLFFGLALLYRHPSQAQNRIHHEPARKLRGAPLWKKVFLNMTFSGVVVVAATYVLEDLLFTSAPASVARIVWNTLAILLTYDFLYYLLHRFAFHKWSRLRPVHVIHHRVRHPTAIDSLYLHPLETFLGLALLLLVIWGFGPVDLLSFGIVFGVYSALNIIVHCGLSIDRPGLRWLSFLARKHDIHHTSMKGGNYASITPIFDILFGTAE